MYKPEVVAIVLEGEVSSVCVTGEDVSWDAEVVLGEFAAEVGTK